MQIRVYSHYFEVSEYTREEWPYVKEFSFKYAEYDLRPVIQAKRWGLPKAKPVMKRVYAGYFENKRVFHFHVNLLEEFKELLASSNINYRLEIIPLYQTQYQELKVLPKYVPREDQKPFIDYIVDEGTSKLANLQTGFGKSMIALYSAMLLKGKILVSIETRFFNLWFEACCRNEKQILDLENDEVLFIKGTDNLVKAMNKAIAGELEHVKVFIVAAGTLSIFLETYERFNGNISDMYPVEPSKFYELFDIKTRIKDEVHLSVFANLREELYMHCPKSISLSATLEDGSFRDKIFKIMFPESMRPREATFNQYIDVTCLFYGLKEDSKKKIRISHPRSTDYSHTAFEYSILKNKSIYRSYLSMIKNWLIVTYLKERQEGMKAVIFFESTKMSAEVYTDLSKLFPNIDFGRYVASLNDDYDKVRDCEVLITTVKSFGTGFDIPNLYCALMTNAIKAQNINLQVLGRLRVLKNYDGVKPKFHYLTCTDISKHLDYHRAKKLQFSGKVNSHSENSLLIEI